MNYNFQLNKVYTFVTTAPAILGATVKNAKLSAIETYERARKSTNVDLEYRKIFPLLLNGTPDNVNACVFYEFISESGERITLADQWIDMSSVEIVEHVTIKVTISGANLNDVSRIRNVINTLGYRTFNIEVAR